MRLLGLLLIVLGIAVALYVGGYLMFIGGIIQIVETARSGAWDSADIAWGVARIVGASCVGFITAVLPVAAGWALLADD